MAPPVVITRLAGLCWCTPLSGPPLALTASVADQAEAKYVREFGQQAASVRHRKLQQQRTAAFKPPWDSFACSWCTVHLVKELFEVFKCSSPYLSLNDTYSPAAFAGLRPSLVTAISLRDGGKRASAPAGRTHRVSASTAAADSRAVRTTRSGGTSAVAADHDRPATARRARSPPNTRTSRGRTSSTLSRGRSSSALSSIRSSGNIRA